MSRERWSQTLIALIAGVGCGGHPEPVNAVRPETTGQAVVLLVPSPKGYVPLACHDPLWADLRGAADCADLIPPGASVRAGDAVVPLGERAPFECVWTRGVVFEAKVGDVAVWPPNRALEAEGVSVELLPEPWLWPAHTQGGWRASVPGLGDVSVYELGGVSGLFFGDPPVIVDHFVTPPQPVSQLDLNDDDVPELLLRVGATWAVYTRSGDRLEGVAGCHIK